MVGRAVWLGVLVTALGPMAAAQEGRGDGPVAAWSFNARLRGLARDIATDTHHAGARLSTQYAESPGGHAILLDGVGSSLVVPRHPALLMTDSVTLDIWVRLETVDTGQPQCLVDKGGERYRLQVEPGGRAMFGLKNDRGRFDLPGGRLQARRWHRITGVFDRPRAYLYVDAELVAEGRWDQTIGPGGDLFIGSKGGVTYFTQGQIDELRISRDPLPPSPDEKPTAVVRGVQSGEAKMTVKRDANGGVTVDTGVAQFELTGAGVVRTIVIQDRPVVSDNTAPLLAAELIESPEYDGWRDGVRVRKLQGVYQPGNARPTETQDTFEAAFTGRLEFGQGDAIETQATMRFAAGSPFMSTAVRLTPVGEFRDRFLRFLAVRMPMNLKKRKRVVQGGDRGVRWNTRHWYQFLVSTISTLLEEPDHNIWRHFVIDQNTPHDYHIWRSESDYTSPLSMQRGIAAPGWIAAYDQQAGLLMGYRELSSRAPKALWVKAQDAGEALAYLHSPTQPALDIHSPGSSTVFGEPHRIDWLPFTDDFRFSQPDLALSREWGLEGLASDPPPRREVPAGEVRLWTASAAQEPGPMVSGGVPFSRAALTDPRNVRLRDGNGDVPLQTTPLAYWPDKSIKWLLLTFPAEGGAVSGAQAGEGALSFELSRRVGAPLAYGLDYGGAARPGEPETRLQAVATQDTVRIDTGPLQLELAAGSEWLTSAKLAGREVLPGGATSYVDFLRPDEPYPCGTTHAQGARDPGVFIPQSVELEESGPLRAVVRLEGMTDSEEPQRMILRLEAYAGSSAVRLTQSVEFLHKDPRAALVQRMGIDLGLGEGNGSTVTFGGQEGPVQMAPGRRAGLRQHSHLGYTAWQQAEGERFQRVVDSRHRSRGWLDMSGARAGVTAALRDMWQQFPNELVADLQSGTLTVGLWPAGAPLMDVRRYSNYPHRSQGESAGTPSSWVQDTWYPNDCFVGVSKTHEVLLYFHDDSARAEAIDSMVADFQRPPLVYAGRDWYRDTGVIAPDALTGNPALTRCEDNLRHFARFWLHHQKLWGWYGMWDYGDVGHYFKGGYGSNIPPDALRALLAGGEQAEGVNVARARFTDYRPNHDWAFDNGRWGWSNTEGLLNLFMQTEYLRTGERDLYFFIEAMARHFRDVDMRHAGRWFGYGTRHGVQHWSDGNHEERQTTHSEFRYHHYLSGDMRSRDFARELYEGVYKVKDVNIHAAHSGRLQGLLTQWEMTGSDEPADILSRYVPAFHVPEGLVESPRVKFPEVERVAATDSVNAGNMFFWTFGAGHGVIEYFELTGNEAVRQALIGTADDALADGNIGLRLKAVAFAAYHADDPEPYREAIREWALGRGRAYLTQIVPHNPDLYSGPRGMLRGSTAGALFVMNDLPYVLPILEEDPPLDDGMRRIDEKGGAFYREPVLSWQSEYDEPEFEEYLRIKHPQP